MKARLKPDAITNHIRALNKSRSPAAGYTDHEWQYKAALGRLEGGTWPVMTRITDGVLLYAYLLIGDMPDRHGGLLKSKVMAVPSRYLDFEDDGVDPPVPISTDHQQYTMFLKDGLQTVRVLTPWTDGFCAFVPVGVQPSEEIAGIRTYAPGNGALSFSREPGSVTIEQAKMYVGLTPDGKQLLAEGWELYNDGFPLLVNRVERVGLDRLKCRLYGEHEYTYTPPAYDNPYLTQFTYEYKGQTYPLANQNLQAVMRYFLANEEKLKEMTRVLP